MSKYESHEHYYDSKYMHELYHKQEAQITPDFQINLNHNYLMHGIMFTFYSLVPLKNLRSLITWTLQWLIKT